MNEWIRKNLAAHFAARASGRVIKRLSGRHCWLCSWLQRGKLCRWLRWLRSFSRSYPRVLGMN